MANSWKLATSSLIAFGFDEHRAFSSDPAGQPAYRETAFHALAMDMTRTEFIETKHEPQ